MILLFFRRKRLLSGIVVPTPIVESESARGASKLCGSRNFQTFSRLTTIMLERLGIDQRIPRGKQLGGC